LSLNNFYKEIDHTILSKNSREVDFSVFKTINSLFLQAILSEHIGQLVQLSDILFQEFGKPFLNPEKFKDIHFNVSHTIDEIAIAVASFSLGFDLEINQDNYPKSLVKQMLHSEDQLKIESSVQFYQLWSIKEAFVKYTGDGLQLSLKNIVVTNDDLDCLTLQSPKQKAQVRKIELLENHTCFVAADNLCNAKIRIINHNKSAGILLNFLSEKN
jgi:4'-phosphopantetheinyl transferase